MQKDYNVRGKRDTPNKAMIKNIMKLKTAGVPFRAIAITVGRSEKRVKELYYREKQVSLDNIK